MFKYIEKEISDAIATKMPKFLVNLLTPAALSVLEGLLDLNYYIAEPYIPRRFPQEMKGISKGADFSYLTIRRLNMFPELI